ncbi:glucoamylase/glucan 1,4-alpha-glucosidase-like protein [Phaeosphaeria sp. MPI-PUGE-AT-0046c]|nr:glucoamylase/glucan 1,4-alpha-glucosidase-like protein [Phaeosphaeria sp. MPI-PUGE-AT-0046c]
MLLNGALGALPATLLLTLPLSSALHPYPRQSASLDDYIKSQADISIKGVLANIGPDGSKAVGAKAGAVVASPSRSDPDYWNTWTRDSSLTFKLIIERFVNGDQSLRNKIDDFVTAQAYLQTISNPSGGPNSGGLGEPRFNVDLTPFEGVWGRPQNDGPALRATALTIYSNWLINNGGLAQAVNTVWPVIEKDLAFTVSRWNQTSFDLWEETSGSSFFTLAATHRALAEGAALANKIGKKCNGCAEAAPQVLCFLQSFWAGTYVRANINVDISRTGKDVNSIISSIHTFDPDSKCIDATFQPCSSRALANHKAVTDSFRTAYTINSGIPAGQAVAVGRYTEDKYYNGNPWYLATTAAAEQLYSAMYQWNRQGSISVDDVSLAFFKDLVADISTGTYAKSSSTYDSIMSAVRKYADGYLAVVQKYTPLSGSLSEQFDRNTGTQLSAYDLTWSYAAFLTATERRAGIVGPTWDESSHNVPPQSCGASCTSKVDFNVRVTTTPGQKVYVVGDVSQLGNWDPASAKELGADKYTSKDPLWAASIDLPAATSFQYKYIIKTSDGQVVWENKPHQNHGLTTSSSCGSTASADDTWKDA